MRTFFYRHKEFLQKNCGDLQLKNWPPSGNLLKAASYLASHAPLPFDERIFSTSVHEILKTSSFPNDPSFFKSFLKQVDLWTRFRNKTLEEFLVSMEGQKWMTARSRMRRTALYELDTAYRASSDYVLKNEYQVKCLLQKYPLLRYQDLKELKIRNAQKIMERYPEQNFHRKKFLMELKASVEVF